MEKLILKYILTNIQGRKWHLLRIGFSLLFFVFLITSCTRINLEEKGVFKLLTDWSKRSPGIEIPSSYTVILGDQILTFSEAENQLPPLFPGNYKALIFNNAENIQIREGIATVSQDNGFLNPLPGWLFSATADLKYQNNIFSDVRVTLQQQIRQLTLKLIPQGGTKDRITAISAELSGVAGAWDLVQNKAHGQALRVPLNFQKQQDGSWQTSIRLIGTLENKQIMQGTVYFADGKPQNLSLNSDLSAAMANFNTDKHIPFALSATFETQTETGFILHINNWVPVSNSGTAN